MTSDLFHVHNPPSVSLYLVTDDLFHVHLYVTLRSVIKEQEGRAKIDKLEKLMVRID